MMRGSAPCRSYARDMPEYKALHAMISGEAYAVFHGIAKANEVSVTALIEALGETLAEEIAAVGDSDLVRQDWVKAARRIDADRRRRRRAGDNGAPV